MAPPLPAIDAIFLECARYTLGTEYRTKLRAAVEALPAEALWWRPNSASNSVGNLLLHLMGNVRQWIVGAIGGAPVSRDRAAEFAAQSGPSGAALLAEMDRLLDEVDRILSRLTTTNLLERRTIQNRDLRVIEAVFHVVEHFALHLGQIIFAAKLQSPGAIRFYEDAGGLAHPLWKQMIRTDRL